MWHPHLSKNWVNEKQFEIIDQKRKTYPAFLQVERKENSFLNLDMFDSKKMQCSCRFVKADVIKDNLNTTNDGTSSTFRTQKLKQNLNEINKNLDKKNRNLPIPGISLFQHDSSKFRLKEKIEEPQLKSQNFLDLSNLKTLNTLNKINNSEKSKNGPSLLLQKRKRFKTKEQINPGMSNPYTNQFTYRYNEPNRLIQNKFNFLPGSLSNLSSPLFNKRQNIGNIEGIEGINPSNINSGNLFPNNKIVNTNANLNLSQVNVQSILEYLKTNSMMMQNIENLLLGNKNLQNEEISNNSQNLVQNTRLQLPKNSEYLDEIAQLSRSNIDHNTNTYSGTNPDPNLYLNSNYDNKQFPLPLALNSFQNNNFPYVNLLGLQNGLQNNIQNIPLGTNLPILDNFPNNPFQMMQNQGQGQGQGQINLPQTDSAQDIFKLAEKLLGKNKSSNPNQNPMTNLQNLNFYG